MKDEVIKFGVYDYTKSELCTLKQTCKKLGITPKDVMKYERSLVLQRFPRADSEPKMYLKAQVEYVERVQYMELFSEFYGYTLEHYPHIVKEWEKAAKTAL